MSPCPDACSDEGKIASEQMSRLDGSDEDVAGLPALKKGSILFSHTRCTVAASSVDWTHLLTIRLTLSKLSDDRFSQSAIPSLVPSRTLSVSLEVIVPLTTYLCLRDRMISLNYRANQLHYVYIYLPPRRQNVIMRWRIRRFDPSRV